MQPHSRHLWAALAVCTLILGGRGSFAQTETKQTELRNFEVVSVDGNKVVVKDEKGSAKEITVTDDFRFTVAGQPVSVHDLKPGMKGSATITTTTTVVPVFVTEVKNGDVMKVTGNSIIVRTDQGMKMFTEGDVKKRGVKIVRDGQPIAFADLHEGDKLSAKIVTEQAPTRMTRRDVEASLTPAPAAARSATAPASGNVSAANTPSAMAAPARHLPKTASRLPIVGAIGLGLLAVAVVLSMRRRWP